MPITDAALLRRAADLIEKQSNWTQHFTARGPIIVAGRQTDPGKDACCLATDKHAVQFSALGAIFRLGRKEKLSNAEIYGLEQRVCEILGVRRLADWNAQVGHAAVLAGLRHTAAAIEG
ncbi:hypothetical protein ABIB58_002837 [Brevundimonas sp. UYEF29]|uniref:DUF6197 family protein n=1 Tax=Brevundimonas sp. UYEF29 TaxID=3156346 RepID=UPI003394DECA